MSASSQSLPIDPVTSSNAHSTPSNVPATSSHKSHTTETYRFNITETSGNFRQIHLTTSSTVALKIAADLLTQPEVKHVSIDLMSDIDRLRNGDMDLWQLAIKSIFGRSWADAGVYLDTLLVNYCDQATDELPDSVPFFAVPERLRDQVRRWNAACRDNLGYWRD